MKATPIIAPRRKITKKGNLIYVAIWSVDKNKNYPEGIKYSFALISKGKRVVGYDYNPTEGHHWHYLKEGKLLRKSYKFKSLGDVAKRFNKDSLKYEKDFGKNENQKS